MTGMMKKAGLAVAMAATALTGMTAAAPAEAQRWGGGYRGGWHGGGGGGWHGGGWRGGYHRGGIGPGGAAVLGGLVGLGVGAAIASDHRGYGYGYGPGPYYGRPYYGGYYGGYYGPRCWRQWRWDPYWGRNVPVRVCD